MAPPKEEPRPDSTGEGGDDGGIELPPGAGPCSCGGVELSQQQTLAARLSRVEERQRAIVEILDRDLRFAAKELRGLLN